MLQDLIDGVSTLVQVMVDLPEQVLWCYTKSLGYNQ